MKVSSTCKCTKVALLSLAVFFGFAVTTPATAAVTATPKAKAKSEKGTTEAPAKLDPTDPGSVIYLDTSGKPAGLGDPNAPPSMAYKAGRGWHPQALSAAGLPRDRYGLIDWAKIVREKIVSPKFSLNPQDEEMPPLQMNVLIPAKGDFVDDVVYPHEMHTYWLKCEVCHPGIFLPAAGQNNMTMTGIVQGQWCGRCHGKVAFPLTDCKRCHSSPKKASAAGK
jgi:c(7)-type cytochrome triheme protein